MNEYAICAIFVWFCSFLIPVEDILRFGQNFKSLFPHLDMEVNGVPAIGPARRSRSPEFVALARRRVK